MSNETIWLHDIVDLISERHIQLRESIELETALLLPEVQLSSIDWYLIDQVAYDEISLVNLSKNTHKSRQATHKNVQRLEKKNILITLNIPNNKKEKHVILTDFGIECYEIYIEAKEKIKNHLVNNIGQNELNYLKKILN